MISQSRVIQRLYDATWGRYVFAGAYDWFLRRAENAGLAEQRRDLVQKAYGATLEIATGTGLNLPHYPIAVSDLILTEPYGHMLELLRRKVHRSCRHAKIIQAQAEQLPFPSSSFDTVVGTMILCSAEHPKSVLAEIARVLRTGGQYLFLEHVRNPDPFLAKRQDQLQPLWYLFANGCHCNRDTVQRLHESDLIVEELSHNRIPRAWKIVEAMISGRARKLHVTRTNGERESL